MPPTPNSSSNTGTAQECDVAGTLPIVIAGHVDHGKSTIIGRLLADTDSLPQGKLRQIRENCRRHSKPFEYAFLIDALKDERAQGITIDAARVFFKTAKRRYIIIDAPGHMEFLKNTITGASRAEAALLAIDAAEGIRENSRRHGYMLSLLGIKQMAVLVNKMDRVDYDEAVFRRIVREYAEFLGAIGLTATCFIPVSGMQGDNICAPSPLMRWFSGGTVLSTLDSFQARPAPVAKPFRMPIQGIYKFTNFNDQRRIVAGTVETGAIKAGDEVIFYPSGKKSRIQALEAFNADPPERLAAGRAAGFTLTEQVYITRGEIACKAGESAPHTTSRLRVNLFWMGKSPLVKDREYHFKLGTARVPMRVTEVVSAINAASLDRAAGQDSVARHEAAECIIACSRPVAFDTVDAIHPTGRFVIVDGHHICGGGIVVEALPDSQADLRHKVFLRNCKWERSRISFEERAEKYNQKSTLILITGRKDAGKKPIAKGLESRLFADGKIVYFLGIGNVLYGVDADIKNADEDRQEHIRRLSEIVNIMLDAGVIVLVTAIELTRADLAIMKTVVDEDRIKVVWIGDDKNTDIPCDLLIPSDRSKEAAVDIIKAMMQENAIIFNPRWFK